MIVWWCAAMFVFNPRFSGNFQKPLSSVEWTARQRMSQNLILGILLWTAWRHAYWFGQLFPSCVLRIFVLEFWVSIVCVGMGMMNCYLWLCISERIMNVECVWGVRVHVGVVLDKHWFFRLWNWLCYGNKANMIKVWTLYDGCNGILYVWCCMLGLGVIVVMTSVGKSGQDLKLLCGNTWIYPAWDSWM